MPNTLEMPRSLKPALICLHISTALYVLVGIIFAFLGVAGLFGVAPPSQDPVEKYMLWGFLFLFVFISLGMAIFIEIVCKHLKQGKYWAWIAALILFGLYVPSLFIVLGIVGLLSLLKPETRAFFGQK